MPYECAWAGPLMRHMDQLSLLPQVTASQLPNMSEAILACPASGDPTVDCSA